MDFDIKFYYQKKRYLLTDELTFYVEVISKKGINLEGYHLIASDGNKDTHFKSTKEYLKNNSADMALKPWSNVTISSFPSSIKLVMYDRNNTQIFCKYLSLRVSKVTKEFFDFKNTNLIVYGLAGSSKSSFLNTLLYMLNLEGKMIKFFREGAGSDHCNSELRMNFLRDLSNEQKTNIAMWDTW